MFKRALQRYGQTPEPITPYQRAAQVWDDRIGSARAQAKNWRLVAFLSLALSAILAAGLIGLASQSKIVPYVVEVDRLGQPTAVAPAASPRQPSDDQIAWHLGHFISLVRSVSTDPVIVRQNWLNAYELVGPDAAATLTQFAQDKDPFGAIGVRSVTVEVQSIVRASKDSFQLKWTESHFERGQTVVRQRWTAFATVKVKPPTTVEALRRNPLGLMITSLSWAQELDLRPVNPGDGL